MSDVTALTQLIVSENCSIFLSTFECFKCVDLKITNERKLV